MQDLPLAVLAPDQQSAPGALLPIAADCPVADTIPRSKAMRGSTDCAGGQAARCCVHQPRRRPRWTTRHRVSCQKHADCRPLLQQSSPNCGRVVQSGKRAAFAVVSHPVRLTDRHSNRTVPGAPGEPAAPHLECLAPGANTSSFVSPCHASASQQHDPRGHPRGF